MTPERADVRRNREKLLRSAVESFAADGPAVAMAEIARRAGLGVATLYRHFPTRDELVAATYRNEIDQLGDITTLLERKDGAGALDAWMVRFIEFARTKRALSAVLQASGASAPTARGTILAALSEILAAGVEDGSLRRDADAADVLRATAGFWLDPEDPDWSRRVDRLSRLIVDGLRAPDPKG